MYDDRTVKVNLPSLAQAMSLDFILFITISYLCLGNW